VSVTASVSLPTWCQRAARNAVPGRQDLQRFGVGAESPGTGGARGDDPVVADPSNPALHALSPGAHARSDDMRAFTPVWHLRAVVSTEGRPTPAYRPSVSAGQEGFGEKVAGTIASR
jgi:hypothetical protein